MSAILGSLIGFASSIVPEIIQGRKEKKMIEYKLKALELEVKLKKELSDAQLEQFLEKQDYLVHSKLIDHDIAISDEDGFIGGMRRSVRPIITYSFFGLFVFLKYSIIVSGIEAGLPLIDLAKTVWDEETAAIFAAVISFWFGNRTIEKRRIKK